MTAKGKLIVLAASVKNKDGDLVPAFEPRAWRWRGPVLVVTGRWLTRRRGVWILFELFFRT